MAKYEEAHKEHINKYKMAHMIGVAEYMRERAKAYDIDPDLAYTVGLLHDIGYLEGRSNHEEASRVILENMGVTDRTVLDAVAWHGTDPNKIIEQYGEDYISPLLVLTYEADLSVDARGFRVGFDNRLADIDTRLKDTPYYDTAVKTVKNTQAFVALWTLKHDIPNPQHMYHKAHHERDER